MMGRMLISLAVKRGDKGPGGSTWNEICSVGTRFTPWLEKDPTPVITTAEMVDQFVANFADELPIDVEHARFDGSRVPEEVMARGWIKAVKRQGDKLMAAIGWVGEAADWIKDGKFKRISIEFGKGQSTDKGKPAGWFLVGASLTNHPFWNVPDLALSVGSLKRLSAHDGGGESSQPDQYPIAQDHTSVAPQEESMSDEMKALAKRLGIREDQVDEHVDTLAVRATEADTSAAEVVTLTARIKTLEDAAKSDAKKAEDDFIALALKDGHLKNDEDHIEDARFVFANRGPEAAARAYMTKQVVKTDPKLEGREDKSKGAEGGDEALSREDAGKQLFTLTTARMTEKGEDYSVAFSAICRTPDHKALVAKYEEV